MFLVDLPDPAIRIERVLDTIDSSMPGGHAIVTIDDLRVPADQMLGASGEGFDYAQVRLSPGAAVALHALARRCASARTRSPPTTPAGARPSASC